MSGGAALPQSPVPDAIDLSTIERALIVKLRHHGDVLLSSPVFSVLKTHAPHIAIDALVYSDTADMLSGHPAIRDIHTVDRRWRESVTFARLKAESALASRLRRAGYQLLVHLTDHPRGARLARMPGVRASVAPAHRRPRWNSSFTHRFPLAGRRHQVELNLDALRRIGIQPGGDERRLVLVPGPNAFSKADSLLKAHGLAPKGFVHIHPTSRWLFKCWPAAAFAELIETLAARGMRVVLTSAPDAGERGYMTELLSKLRSKPVDLSAALSLKELAALTSRARLFVGVDSAPMHIAAAMGTPAVALFGPSGEFEWAPWGVPHRVVAANEFACRPCGFDGCGGGKVSECLTTLAPARVLAGIDELLATT